MTDGSTTWPGNLFLGNPKLLARIIPSLKPPVISDFKPDLMKRRGGNLPVGRHRWNGDSSQDFPPKNHPKSPPKIPNAKQLWSKSSHGSPPSPRNSLRKVPPQRTSPSCWPQNCQPSKSEQKVAWRWEAGSPTPTPSWHCSSSITVLEKPKPVDSLSKGGGTVSSHGSSMKLSASWRMWANSRLQVPTWSFSSHFRSIFFTKKPGSGLGVGKVDVPCGSCWN